MVPTSMRDRIHVTMQNLRVTDTPGRFPAMIDKGDNFCEFMLNFLQCKCLLIRGLF